MKYNSSCVTGHQTHFISVEQTKIDVSYQLLPVLCCYYFQTSDIKDDIELLILTLFDVVMEAVANNKSTIMVRFGSQIM